MKKQTDKPIERNLKIDMTVTLKIAFNPNMNEKERENFANMLAKNYVSCLGDKDILITNLEFV